MTWITETGREFFLRTSLEKTPLPGNAVVFLDFPMTAQLPARHSDINPTMNTYTMLGICDQAHAVESLPPIPQLPAMPNRQQLSATG